MMEDFAQVLTGLLLAVCGVCMSQAVGILNRLERRMDSLENRFNNHIDKHNP